mgnify:FL=1
MSLMRSALMFAGTSFAIAFVMEASIDANGALDRVLDQTQHKVEVTAISIYQFVNEVAPELLQVKDN